MSLAVMLAKGARRWMSGRKATNRSKMGAYRVSVLGLVAGKCRGSRHGTVTRLPPLGGYVLQ
jgi:hypothetical protein